MADNKAKRPFSLAQHHAQPHAQPKPQLQPQPQSQPQPQLTGPKPNPQSDATEQMPVKTFTYRAIAELNAGFEKVLQDLKALQCVGYLPTERLAALGDLIGRLRAETNRDLIATLHGRELANQAYFDHLCRQWEKPAAG